MTLAFLAFGTAESSGVLSLSVILATTFLSLLLLMVGEEEEAGRAGK